MSAPDDPLAEHARCPALKQKHLDKLTAEGVPPSALMRTALGGFSCFARDLVVAQDGRFEFHRYSAHHEAQWAYVWPAHDEFGDVADLVAWRPKASVATWLGRVGLLGQEMIYAPRLGDPLNVFPDALAWLRAGRDGLCVIDPSRSASLLREAGTLKVATVAEGRSLRDLLTMPVPQIVVDEASLPTRRAA